MLSILIYLKSKNIMHRDIKLENVMFKNNSKEDIVLVDFGAGENFLNENLNV